MKVPFLPPASKEGNVFICVYLSVILSLYRALPLPYKALALAPSPGHTFKLVQLGPHCTRTPPPSDMFKLVYYESWWLVFNWNAFLLWIGSVRLPTASAWNYHNVMVNKISSCLALMNMCPRQTGLVFSTRNCTIFQQKFNINIFWDIP